MHLKSILRPLIAFALIAVFISSMSFAQTRKHDFSLSYGVVSSDQLADILSDVLTIVITLGTFHKDNMHYPGVLFLTYHYSANSRFGFGAAVGGYNSSGELWIGESAAGTFKERNYVGALEIDYHWVMREGFHLYSGAGFGVRFRRGTYSAMFDTDTVNKALPTFHVNLLGFRVGKTIGFFGEAGFGYKGLFSAGLNAQF